MTSYSGTLCSGSPTKFGPYAVFYTKLLLVHLASQEKKLEITRTFWTCDIPSCNGFFKFAICIKSWLGLRIIIIIIYEDYTRLDHYNVSRAVVTSNVNYKLLKNCSRTTRVNTRTNVCFWHTLCDSETKICPC